MSQFNYPVHYDSFNDYPAYKGDDLEVTYNRARTAFRLWSPDSDEVKIRIYEDCRNTVPLESRSMNKDEDGTWTYAFTGDLNGRFYTFQIKFDGTWLPETPGAYAVAVGANGTRGAVIDLRDTDPDGWEDDKSPACPSPCDAIIYELHVRDFSMSPDSGIKNKGKFLAFTEHGTVNSFGQKTGIDHLKELGVTHVHLLPVFDFASINELRPEDNLYNWGYDPANFNVPEGSYSTNPEAPGVRINEFKQMVMALHQSGIAVVMDVVYNHTWKWETSNFTYTAPGYYYRQFADGSYGNASGCGNETATDREMVRRYIINSLKHWVREYHIDGFRFDLMGIYDIETMNLIRSELDALRPGIIIYGEGWTGGDSPLPYERRAVKNHVGIMPGVAAFSDDLRDALRGSWGNIHDPGFVCGKQGYDETIKFGVTGATKHPQIHYGLINYSNGPYANDPSQVVNYVSCHDDLCLNDRLRISAPQGSSEQDMLRYNRLAQTIVLTSQGLPFIYAGEELMRSKKGVHNTYQSPDSINRIEYDNKHEHWQMFAYLRDLIALRRAHPAFRISSREMLCDCLHFLYPNQACVVGYTLDNNANGDSWNRILVVYNGNRHIIGLGIPKDQWWVACNGETISQRGLYKWNNDYLNVPPNSAMILFKP